MGEAHLINCIFHMAQIIYTNGKTTDVYPKNGTDFSLEELQAVVGGYIELVFLGDKILVANEEGKLYGLPLNTKATEIIRNYGYNDTIVGNVVYCEKKQIR